MARTRYATDRGLIARMGATMFLLGLVFTAFIIAVVLLLTNFTSVSGDGIIFIAVIAGVAVSFGSFYWSDKIALATAGARLVTPQQAPELHGVVDRLCALADMPKPRIAISPTDMPNAFATGRSSKVAVLCVTEGLLRRLDTNEPRGRHLARDVARRPQGRSGHDDRVVPRHHGRPAGQVRLLLRAVRRWRP